MAKIGVVRIVRQRATDWYRMMRAKKEPQCRGATVHLQYTGDAGEGFVGSTFDVFQTICTLSKMKQQSSMRITCLSSTKSAVFSCRKLANKTTTEHIVFVFNCTALPKLR